MDVLQTILYVLIGLFKFLGMLALGLGLGWLIVDYHRKGEGSWQVQVAFLASLFAFLMVLARFVHVALAGFGLGLGLAIFIWALPKRSKKEED